MERRLRFTYLSTMTEELRVVALADDCVNDDDDDSVVGDDVDNDALELVDESMANEELDDCTDEDEVGGVLAELDVLCAETADELVDDRLAGGCWHFFPADTSRTRSAAGNA